MRDPSPSTSPAHTTPMRPYISPISPLYLPCISATSRLYLRFVSPPSPSPHAARRRRDIGKMYGRCNGDATEMQGRSREASGDLGRYREMPTPMRPVADHSVLSARKVVAWPEEEPPSLRTW